MIKNISAILFFLSLIIFLPEYVRPQEKSSDSLFKIKVNGKYGFIDKTGKIVIPPQFQGVDDFSEGLAKIYVGGEFDTAYIDETGRTIIAPKFDIGSDFSEGFAWVGFDPEKKPYKIGPHTYYSSQCTHCFNYNIGFINRSGEFITEAVFKSAGDFSEGLALVETRENKYGYIDKTGKFAIQPTFDWADDFSEGLAAVFVNGKYGFVDKTGKMVVKPKYTKAGKFSEGLAYVKLGGRVRKPEGDGIIETGLSDTNFAYIDRTGRIVFKINADKVENFSEGLARFEKFGVSGFGFVDKTGKVVNDTRIDAASEYSEGLAVVFLGEDDGYGFGFVDKSGKIVIKTNYHLVSDFKNGLAEFQERNSYESITDTRFGYIDRTGKVIWRATK